MKRLVLLGVVALTASPAGAKPPAITCPGETTVEMRTCAERSWQQSEAQLRSKLSKQLMQQWQATTRSVCAAAYAPYKDGTIYPQLVVGCDDRLNRVLLQEFKPMDAR